MDIGGSLHNYQSDISRTIQFGKADEEKRKAWDIVRKAQQAALDAIRPGVNCSSIDEVARRVMETDGYGPGYKFFLHR